MKREKEVGVGEEEEKKIRHAEQEARELNL